MPRKRKFLDEAKRKEILAIVSLGCSRETAARYVGCSSQTIRNEMKQDEKFAEEIRIAEERSEIFFLEKIRKAANKEQYWRAAAWALERRCPNRYAARGAQSLSEEQVLQLVSDLTEIVVPEVQNAAERRRILQKVKKLIRTLDLSETSAVLESTRNEPPIDEAAEND